MATREDGRKRPDRLEEEVAATRERLEHTTAELIHRLSPGELVDQVLGYARTHGGEFGRNLGHRVKDNPLPLLLTGVGITWLMASDERGYDGRGAYGDGGAYGEASYGTDMGSDDSGDGRTAELRDRAGEAGRRASEKAGEWRESAAERSARARERMYRTRERLSGQLQDQPLLAGSLGIALGAALGAMLPSSEQEDALLGRHSDRATERARRAAGEDYQHVRENVRQRTEHH